MTFPKKGSRKIQVDGAAFRWKCSQWRQTSEWRAPEQGQFDPDWLEQARRFGLGDVAPVATVLCVELMDEPVSQLTVACLGIMVDGFWGPEPLTQIKPAFVREVIAASLTQGWNPTAKGDISVEVAVDSAKQNSPVLLVIPGMTQSIGGYENTENPRLLWSKAGEAS